jgi:hypothetical protein
MAVEPLPDETYAYLAGDRDMRVRAFLAEVRFLPDSVRRRLLIDDQPVVRRAALRGWPTPPPDDVVDMLLTDSDPDVAREARLARPETARAELMAGLTEEFDMNRSADVARLSDLEELARAVPLTPDLAVTLVDDRRRRLRKAVAQNASLPPDLVARLAVDPDPSVRLAVSMRPDLTEEWHAAIDYEVRPEDRLSPPRWVLRSLDDLTLMSRCAQSAHTGLRRFAARSPHLTPDLVNALAEDPDFAVRLLLCENHPNAPADLLLRTYLEAQVATSGDLLAKPNFPRSGLARDATSEDSKRRHLALLDAATTPEQVERLSHDEERYGRSAAASDRRLSLARVRELLADPATAESAAANPLVPVRFMHENLDEADVPPHGGHTERSDPCIPD